MLNEPLWEPDWFLQSVLNHHIDELVKRYACLRALRVDLFYKKHTSRFCQDSAWQFKQDTRQLMDCMMQQKNVVGYFWVIEWTEDHRYHAHVVFWLDGSRVQKTYLPAQQAGSFWEEITEQEGWFHRCEFKAHYRANIDLPVRYNDPGSIDNIRQVLAYLTKIQQKDGLSLYGCNEVPERPAAGRPRSVSL